MTKTLEKEIARTNEMYSFERRYADFAPICGIDEVGRGPLAGPVVTAAVILPQEYILYLNDSKKVSEKKRKALYEELQVKAVSIGIGMADELVIDEINILYATYQAMRHAISKLDITPGILLNDAVKIPEVDIKQIPIIKGDTLSASIAAASIIAKVTRDNMMEEYALTYPEYGFEKHKGYGTAAHIEAIRKYGLCPIHRKSFTKKLHKFTK